jgi:hypothetical protein
MIVGTRARSRGASDPAGIRGMERAVVAVAIAALLAACRGVEPLPAEALQDIASLDGFKAAFNAAADRPRLLLLVAPT